MSNAVRVHKISKCNLTWYGDRVQVCWRNTRWYQQYTVLVQSAALETSRLHVLQSELLGRATRAVEGLDLFGFGIEEQAEGVTERVTSV